MRHTSLSLSCGQSVDACEPRIGWHATMRSRNLSGVCCIALAIAPFVLTIRSGTCSRIRGCGRSKATLRSARHRRGDALVTSLRREDARGGFPTELYSALQRDEALALEIAWSLVDAHFPPSLHLDLLDAVGISPKVECVWRRTRDSEFSRRVLDAYHNSCAVCGFAVRMNGGLLALDAAHIKWHCASGPDHVSNGIALCALHHRLFDAGAFTVSLEQQIAVAPTVGGSGFDETLERYRNKAFARPILEADSPDPEFLTWHHREVFGSDPAEEHHS